jgi:hypothetical protein
MTGASLRTTGGGSTTGGVTGVGFVVVPPQLDATNVATAHKETIAGVLRCFIAATVYFRRDYRSVTSGGARR